MSVQSDDSLVLVPIWTDHTAPDPRYVQLDAGMASPVKFWTGTQAAYNNLGVYDPLTQYWIVG